MTDANFQAQLAELVQIASIQNDRVSRLEELSLAMGRNVEALNTIIEAHDQRMASLERLSSDHSEQMGSLNAAIERLDRIIDYLINRDRPSDAAE